MALTPEQRRVARIALRAGGPDMFLAGGAALIENGITDRATRDIDAFLSTVGDTFAAADAVRGALEAEGHTVSDISPTEESVLRRFRVSRKGGTDVVLDIGKDSRLLPGVVTSIGSTLSPLELAANKVGALYGDPSRVRDVDDLANALRTLEWGAILAVADRKEAHPLDRRMLAVSFHEVSRADASEFPETSDVEAIRAFAKDMASHLRDGTPPPRSPYADAPATSTEGRCGSPKKRGGLCRRRVSERGCPYHG